MPPYFLASMRLLYYPRFKGWIPHDISCWYLKFLELPRPQDIDFEILN